jgi:hypothetical protein
VAGRFKKMIDWDLFHLTRPLAITALVTLFTQMCLPRPKLNQVKPKYFNSATTALVTLFTQMGLPRPKLNQVKTKYFNSAM